MPDALSIGEVAARSGVGHLGVAVLRGGGADPRGAHRGRPPPLPRSVIRLVAFIVFAQKVGLTLDEIGGSCRRLPRNRVPDRADWAKLSSLVEEADPDRIAELERLELGLTECIGCGCLSLDRCRLANPGDRAARRGSGPALLD